jgi:hypothetical protein
MMTGGVAPMATLANSGNGGTSAYVTGNGVAGGSGYCLISYWS